MVPVPGERVRRTLCALQIIPGAYDPLREIPMNIDPANGASASSSASKASPAIPKRINVAVNAEMVAALDNVIQHEGVTLTEACRRLIGYGDFIYRMAKQEKAAILVRTAEGTKELVLV